MDPETITLGKYSLPVVLTVLLGLIFKNISISDSLKPFIAAGCGIVLGIAALFYNQPESITFPVVVDFVLAGAIAGTSATGIYEMIKPQGAKKYSAVDSDGRKIPGARVVVARPKVIS